MAMVQHQWYHFGIGAPPISVWALGCSLGVRGFNPWSYLWGVKSHFASLRRVPLGCGEVLKKEEKTGNPQPPQFAAGALLGSVRVGQEAALRVFIGPKAKFGSRSAVVKIKALVVGFPCRSWAVGLLGCWAVGLWLSLQEG